MRGMRASDGRMRWLRRMAPALLLLAPLALYAGADTDTEADIARLKEKYANAENVRGTPIEGLYDWDTLDFLPDETTHQLLVFTDVDCGYCRRLHQQMAEYHRLGIGLRYAVFPRSGPGTDTWSALQPSSTKLPNPNDP